MSWIFLTGVDKTGKSTIAKELETKGYKIIHLKAPAAKYYKAGYTGPTYLEDILDLYLTHTGKDVVWDRTPHEEHLWASVYGAAKVLIPKEELEPLQEFEQQNESKYFVLHDSDPLAHWQRCVEAKEPLTKSQFNEARQAFLNLSKEFGFIVTTYDEVTKKGVEMLVNSIPPAPQQITNIIATEEVEAVSVIATPKSIEQLTLEKANAINKILENKILKFKGLIYDDIEKELKQFLNEKLAILLGMKQDIHDVRFNLDEMKILKMYCDTIKNKMGIGERKHG